MGAEIQSLRPVLEGRGPAQRGCLEAILRRSVCRVLARATGMVEDSFGTSTTGQCRDLKMLSDRVLERGGSATNPHKEVALQSILARNGHSYMRARGHEDESEAYEVRSVCSGLARLVGPSSRDVESGVATIG